MRDENRCDEYGNNGQEELDFLDTIDVHTEGEESPLDLWIKKSPQARFAEVEYLNNSCLGYPFQITSAGTLQQVFKVDKWIFLMELTKTFPKETEDDQYPIRVCLVSPNLAELKKVLPSKKIVNVEQDSAGVDYLIFDTFEDEYIRYLNGQNNRLLTETMLLHTREWVGGMLHAIQVEKQYRRPVKETGKKIPSFMNWGRQRQYEEPAYYGYGERRAKYTDGRASEGYEENPHCRKIVLSDRAFIQIYNESQSRIQTETGGLLLGHYEDGVWYVIEASDPGINAKFYNAYHEGDDVYENHVCGVISRTYKHPLVFLGMWHRHPGSLDSFSGTDDGTNYKYAGSAGNGCISAIINYDPQFRITFYYAEQGDNRRVYYTEVDIEVGDDKIPNKEMLKVASIEDVRRRNR